MKVLFLVALFSTCAIAMQKNEETGKRPNELSYFDKQLLAQQATACALMNSKIQQIHSGDLKSINSGKDIERHFIYSNEVHGVNVSYEAHQACTQLLEKFAQSIKDNNNTNDKNGSLGDSL